MMSQSWIMMYAAGGAWQYGKRRISAMSNEEFNKLLPIDLLKEHTEMLRSAIPTISKSIQDMTPLINTLMTQFGTFVNEAIKAIPQTITNVLGTPGGEFSNIPTTAGQTGTGLPPPGTAAFLHYFKTLSEQTQATPEQLQSGQLEEFENTKAKREAIQAEQTRWVKRQQDLLFAKARAEERKTQRAVIPAAHIKSRARSNVSMQSLKIEKARLNQTLIEANRQLTVSIRTTGQGRGSKALVERKRKAVTLARQKLANFNAMHGARF